MRNLRNRRRAVSGRKKAGARAVWIALIAMMMLVSAACGKNTKKPAATETPAAEATATPEVTAEAAPEATPTGEAEPTPTSEVSPEVTPTGAAEATPTPEITKTVEKSGDIVILFTGDVHCGVDKGIGYAGLWEIRRHLQEQGDEVILVDDGDNIQGEPLGTMTRGEELINLMNKMGYSVAVPGNHEFDYGMEQFLALSKKAEFNYISCNFNYKGELVLQPYVICEIGGRKIGFVGVTTPETLTTSTPMYFQDGNKEYVYGFLQDDTGKGVYDAVQKATDAARAEGAEYVVVVGHLGNEAENKPFTYADVIANTDGFDVLLDGHSHDTDCVTMNNKSGSKVLRGACGTKLENVGWCRIASDGTITMGLYSWEGEISAPEAFNLDNEMTAAVAEAFKVLGDKFEEVVATSAVDLTIHDPVAVDENDKPIRMIRRAETNLGDLVADAYRVQSGADIGICNGGGIRETIKAGDITLREIMNVHPYGNYLCVIELTGQQILDALEWGAHSAPGENGGFLQVSGLTYEVHTYIDPTCTSDDYGMFTGITGERRVKNVLVGGEPIDPDRKYTVAGHNYLLLENGDGYTMFDGAPLLQDCVKLDNQVLIDYIRDSLGGVIGEEYTELTGQGRIVFVEEQQ